MKDAIGHAMLFSIVIPTYNRAELLSQAIESVLSQTHSNREILVVDDGSSDDTQSMVRKFRPSVSYVRQENQGKSAAVNLGHREHAWRRHPRA